MCGQFGEINSPPRSGPPGLNNPVQWAIQLDPHDRPGVCNRGIGHRTNNSLIHLAMVTTDLPQLVAQLDRFASVSVHDHLDTIDVEVQKPIDISMVDDLMCDALFVDPLDRTEHARSFIIRLGKRDRTRRCGDLRAEDRNGKSRYIISHLD